MESSSAVYSTVGRGSPLIHTEELNQHQRSFSSFPLNVTKMSDSLLVSEGEFCDESPPFSVLWISVSLEKKDGNVAFITLCDL